MAKLGKLNMKARAEQGAQMIVRDPFGEVDENGVRPALLAADKTPATLTLLGADSGAARRLSYQRSAVMQNRVYAAATRRKGIAVLTAEDVAQQEEFDLDRLVALTTDWHGFEDDYDIPIPFSPEAVRALYESNPLICEQAIAFIDTRAEFFGQSSTPSAITPPISLG